MLWALLIAAPFALCFALIGAGYLRAGRNVSVPAEAVKPVRHLRLVK